VGVAVGVEVGVDEGVGVTPASAVPAPITRALMIDTRNSETSSCLAIDFPFLLVFPTYTVESANRD